MKTNQKILNMQDTVQHSYDNKGITLIALVITIVILIILATISMNLIFGDDGLISKAKLSKNISVNSTAVDKADQANLIEAVNAILNNQKTDVAQEPYIDNALVVPPQLATGMM